MASTSTEITISISIYRGWVVTVAAALTGLVLGILYIWSVVRAGIPVSWGWSKADMALPYSTMCAFFAITMIPAGRLQDRFGPRIAILLGGLLAGLGCVISGLGGSSLTAYIIGFGVFTGSGVGFGYAATTPASIKWFPPQRTGLIAGIVVAGFGLAPVVLAPLTARLLDLFATTTAQGVVEKGVSETMIALGILTWIVVGVLALLVRNPPEGHLVQPPAGAAAARAAARPEFTWRQMLRTTQFWLLFAMYFFGASAGLTFISVASDLGKHALGSLAFLVVVVLAVGNSSGRILTGTLSDRIGRQWTLLVEFVWQALVIAALYKLSGGDASWIAHPGRRLHARLQLRHQPRRVPGRLQGLLRDPQLRPQLRLPVRGVRLRRPDHAVGQRLHRGQDGLRRPVVRHHHRPAGVRRGAEPGEQGRGPAGARRRGVLIPGQEG